MKKPQARMAQKKAARINEPGEAEGTTTTSLEEAVFRMKHGISLDKSAPLPSNAVNSEVEEFLLEIELRALKHTGQIDQVLENYRAKIALDKLENSSTEKIVAQIKAKKSLLE